MARVHHLIALLCAASLCGCEDSPKDKLQGTWIGTSVENVPADELAEVTTWAQGTSFTFKGSKVQVAIPAESPRKGSFKIKEQDGNRLTLAFVRPEGGQDLASFRILEDALQWELEDGRTITLKKKPKLEAL